MGNHADEAFDMSISSSYEKGSTFNYFIGRLHDANVDQPIVENMETSFSSHKPQLHLTSSLPLLLRRGILLQQ